MDPVSKQWITLALIVLIAALVVASDVWLVHAYGVSASYSRVTARLFARHPVLVAVVSFAAGCVIGHCLLNTEAR